jgi:hypothetical protein
VSTASRKSASVYAAAKLHLIALHISDYSAVTRPRRGLLIRKHFSRLLARFGVQVRGLLGVKSGLDGDKLGCPLCARRLRSVTITIDDGQRVSGLLQAPNNARICYVLAHGAGAGMTHPFMVCIAEGLAERGIATLRYQFPYMEQERPDPNLPKRRFARRLLKHHTCFQRLAL